jgi:hypothetical protein
MGVSTEVFMDGSRFDTLARAIAERGTRRQLVSLLLTLPLGGVLAVADEAGEVVAERPLDRVQRRTKQRTRKQRNNKNNRRDNRRGQDNSNSDVNNKPCSSSADCQKGRTCCRGTCCQLPANQCNLEGMCCAPNCAGRTCGPDGCGKGGTCGSCGVCQTCTARGTCEPVPNGTVCGTSSHGGTTIRCCNGTCPDPDCVPSGAEREGCPGPCGVNGQNCCSAGSDSGFCLGGDPPSRCYCTIFGFPGMRCGSDNECERSGLDITACICGTCQLPPS